MRFILSQCDNEKFDLQKTLLSVIMKCTLSFSVKKLSAENIQNDPTFNFTIQGNSCGFSSHPLYIRSSGSSGVRFSSILGGCVIPCLPLKI